MVVAVGGAAGSTNEGKRKKLIKTVKKPKGDVGSFGVGARRFGGLLQKTTKMRT